MPDLGGGYSMNPQLAKAAANQTAQAGDTRATPEEAGYMELDGAQKDADCSLVSGGVSSARGCCNLFDPVQAADGFRCGACTKVKQGATTMGDQGANAGAGGGDTTTPPAGGARQEA